MRNKLGIDFLHIMIISLLPVISYILVSSFTPGPSNISSASMAVLHGYKNTLKYQAGLAVGVFLLMLLSGLLSTTLARTFPAFEPIMRYAGAVYILYLAFGILKASYTFTEKDSKPLGFVHGFMLQVLNPKLLVYAFTLFSAFLSTMSKDITVLLLVVTLLALVAFCAASTWALFGTAIKTHLHHPRLKTVINIILSLSLVYTAISLTGII
jgi:cysteine/O-acetylserine efflux protein